MSSRAKITISGLANIVGTIEIVSLRASTVSAKITEQNVLEVTHDIGACKIVEEKQISPTFGPSAPAGAESGPLTKSTSAPM